MQQDLVLLRCDSRHGHICSIACISLKIGLGDQLNEEVGNDESGAIFVGTSDGFLLRYCYTITAELFSKNHDINFKTNVFPHCTEFFYFWWPSYITAR